MGRSLGVPHFERATNHRPSHCRLFKRPVDHISLAKITDNTAKPGDPRPLGISRAKWWALNHIKLSHNWSNYTQCGCPLPFSYLFQLADCIGRLHAMYLVFGDFWI